MFSSMLRSIFCYGCILKWVDEKAKCPLCFYTLEEKDFGHEYTLRRDILNLKGECKSCNVQGPMAALLKEHQKCEPEMKLIYPFDKISEGTTVRVLTSSKNWAYCKLSNIVSDEGRDIVQIPLGYLKSVIPPPWPMFNNGDLQEMLLDGVNSTIEAKINERIVKSLRTIIKCYTSEAGRIDGEMKSSAEQKLVQLAMERFPNDHTIQLLCCDAIHRFCEKKINGEEMLSPANMHWNVQKAMQLWPNDPQIQLHSLVALSYLARQNPSKLLDHAIFMALENAMTINRNVREVQRMALSTFCSLFSSIFKTYVAKSQVYELVQAAMRTFPNSKSIQQDAVQFLSYLWKNSELFQNQALDSKVHLLIKTAMNRFPQNKDLQRDGCITLAYFWEKDESHRQALLQYNVRSEVGTAAKLCLENMRIQQLLKNLSVESGKSIKREPEESIKRNAKDSNYNESSLSESKKMKLTHGLKRNDEITIQSSTSPLKLESTKVLKRIGVLCNTGKGRHQSVMKGDHEFIKKIMSEFCSDYDLQLLCLDCICRFCDNGGGNNRLVGSQDIHLEIQKAMRHWPHDLQIQLKSLKAIQLFFFHCRQNKKRGVSCNIVLDVCCALKYFPNDSEIQANGTSAISRLLFDKEGCRSTYFRDSAIADYGKDIIDVIQKSMTLHPKDTAIQVNALAILFYYRESRPFKELAHFTFIHRQIQNAMQNFPKWENIQTWALDVLEIISARSNSFHDQTAGTKVHLLIQGAMQRWPETEHIQSTACKILAHIWNRRTALRLAFSECQIKIEVEKATKRHTRAKSIHSLHNILTNERSKNPKKKRRRSHKPTIQNFSERYLRLTVTDLS